MSSLFRDQPEHPRLLFKYREWPGQAPLIWKAHEISNVILSLNIVTNVLHENLNLETKKDLSKAEARIFFRACRGLQ